MTPQISRELGTGVILRSNYNENVLGILIIISKDDGCTTENLEKGGNRNTYFSLSNLLDQRCLKTKMHIITILLSRLILG